MIHLGLLGRGAFGEVHKIEYKNELFALKLVLFLLCRLILASSRRRMH